MEAIFSSKEIYSIDENGVLKYKIPSLLLMENAGKNVVVEIKNFFGDIENKNFLIFCGKGNNGGDGFVIARHLFNLGAKVEIVLIGKISELKNDAKINFEIVKKIKKQFPNNLCVKIFSKNFFKRKIECDVIIDAIFGTGFSHTVKPPFVKIINWINQSGKKIVAIDIPSGINSDNGKFTTCAVKSDLTVTMFAKKNGHLINDGKIYSGQIAVADISIPKTEFVKKANKFLIEKKDIQKFFPQRKFDVNKYSIGKVFVIGSSQQYPSSSVMASLSALRSGSGAVVLGTVSSIFPFVAKKLTEVLIEKLDETNDGTISISSKEKIFEKINWANCIAIGCGIGTNLETQNLVSEIISTCEKPLAIDADALKYFERKNFVKPKFAILTPHIGEFSRMTKISVKEIEENRVQIISHFAKKFNSIIVLKGSPTIIADKKGNIFFNSTGNSGMATVGSGDVLTGIIAGIFSQMKNDISCEEKLLQSAICGVYIHGKSGDIANEKFGNSLLATDIIQNISNGILKTLHE